MEKSASGKQLWRLNQLAYELRKDISLPLTKEKASFLITSFKLEKEDNEGYNSLYEGYDDIPFGEENEVKH